jgi:signal transduction histidine kinase
MNETGRTLRDQVAHVLNGDLQGRLAAVAIALQAHIDDLGRGGHPSTVRLVEQVTALLRLADRDIAELVTEPVPPLRLDEVLGQLRSRWAGLLTVGWGIEPAAQVLLDDDVILLRWASEVIDHSVSNSSRHGAATALTVHVSTSGVAVGWLRIRVQDNGCGPLHDEELGGSGARSVAERQGSWALRGRAVGGAELTVDLPGRRWSSDHYA